MARIPTISLRLARSRLAMVWFPLSGLLFLVMVVQTFSGAFGTNEQAAWGWALPNFLPTLALMGSVFAANAMEATETKKSVVRLFFFRLAFWLSLFYFLILFIVIFAPAVSQVETGAAATAEVRLSTMERSNIFLGPLQSFVVGVIGALFILKQDEKINAPAPQ